MGDANNSAVYSDWTVSAVAPRGAVLNGALNRIGLGGDHPVVPTQSAVLDEIVVSKSRSLYVNAGWLAELSPFFAGYCFGEHAVESFVVQDRTYSEVLEFVRCIFYCPMRKPLSVQNVGMVMEMATAFGMRPVMVRCEEFVLRTAHNLDRNRLFQMTCTLSACDPNSSTMSVLVDQLARIPDDQLEDLQFSQMPGEVVADVFSMRIKKKEQNKRRQRNSFFSCCLM